MFNTVEVTIHVLIYVSIHVSTYLYEKFYAILSLVTHGGYSLTWYIYARSDNYQ